ncbi:hypothetical protein LCGC14_0394110 [marine sediment metagenome]|uniref:Uncharacterized protein n=1 Tax=marine sediment metagenome TaxID=412755 RepID=A0A0F9VKN9_9ZZZZ
MVRRTFTPRHQFPDIPGLRRELDEISRMFLNPTAVKRTPSSATDSGNQGDWTYDSSYLYLCTADNTWRRIAHSTW